MFWSSRDCAPSIEAGMGAIPWLYCRALWLLLLKSEQNVRLTAGGKLLHHADFLEIHLHPKQTTPLSDSCEPLCECPAWKQAVG